MSENPNPPPLPVPGEGDKAADPRIGQSFGKYQVLRILGKGGMGVVYEGIDEGLKRNVAIKFLPPDVLKKTDVIDRFMREAQVTARLSHPNIIAIFDVSKDDRGCYMVMELLSPASAGSYLKKKGHYTWPVATRIIADCCAALKVAHDAGIVHRDIKPDNVLAVEKIGQSFPRSSEKSGDVCKLSQGPVQRSRHCGGTTAKTLRSRATAADWPSRSKDSCSGTRPAKS